MAWLSLLYPYVEKEVQCDHHWEIHIDVAVVAAAVAADAVVVDDCCVHPRNECAEVA